MRVVELHLRISQMKNRVTIISAILLALVIGGLSVSAEEAKKETQLLLRHPGAFAMGLAFVAIANVP